MTRLRADLLARLDDAVLDRTSSVADILNTCLMVGIRIGATSLRQWATAELEGYRSLDVPEYRKIRAQILQVVADPWGRSSTQLLNILTLPEPIRKAVSEIVPLNQGVAALEALAAEHEAQQRRVQLSPPTFDAYTAAWNRRADRPYSIVAVYAEFPPSLIRGVVGERRTVLTEFVAELGTEVGAGDAELPPARRADDLLSELVGPSVISSLIIFTGNSHAGDVVTYGPGDEYNFGDITGNVAAGSSNVTQNYNAGFDITKVREFAGLITEITGQLDLEPGPRAELAAAAAELSVAIDDPAADKGRMRRAVDAVLGPLKLAGATALRNAAINIGNQAGAELDAAIHHLHP